MKTQQFYNKISPIYFLIDLFLSQYKKVLIEEINSYTESSVLEVGVGFGKHIKYYNHTEIVGIDFSEKMLKKARKFNPKISLLQMNGEDMNFTDSSFDLVVCSHVLSTHSNPDSIIAECLRILKPNGRLILLNNSAQDDLSHIYSFLEFLGRWFHFSVNFSFDNLQALKPLTLIKRLKFGWNNSIEIRVYGKTTCGE